VERRARQAEEGERWRLYKNSGLIVAGLTALVVMQVSGYHTDLTDWDLQTKRYCKQIFNWVIWFGCVSTVAFLGGFSYHDLLCACLWVLVE
jgi:hypothetical protein